MKIRLLCKIRSIIVNTIDEKHFVECQACNEVFSMVRNNVESYETYDRICQALLREISFCASKNVLPSRAGRPL